MLILHCPYCGADVDETDLHAGGEAHLKRFGPDSSDEAFEGYLFMRENPKGVHFERWHHSYGCGKWFWRRVLPTRLRSSAHTPRRRWNPRKRSRMRLRPNDPAGHFQQTRQGGT